jgi:hypothetical protein
MPFKCLQLFADPHICMAHRYSWHAAALTKSRCPASCKAGASCQKENEARPLGSGLAFRLKACYARRRQLGGLMMWSAEEDDDLELARSVRAQIDSPKCDDFVLPTCGEPGARSSGQCAASGIDAWLCLGYG